MSLALKFCLRKTEAVHSLLCTGVCDGRLWESKNARLQQGDRKVPNGTSNFGVPYTVVCVYVCVCVCVSDKKAIQVNSKSYENHTPFLCIANLPTRFKIGQL